MRGTHHATPTLRTDRARSCPLAPIDRSPTDGTSSEGSAIHRPLQSNRHVAALLSSLWPGLGQLVLGARRSGWLLAAPPLILLGLVVAALATRDKISLLALFLDPNVIGALLAIQLLVLVWRLLAVTDAFRRGHGAIRRAAPRSRRSRSSSCSSRASSRGT